MPPNVAHLLRGEALSFSAFQPPAKPKAPKPPALNDLSYIPAAHRPSISSRDTLRLETPVTQRKQTTRTNPNRDKTRIFHNAISTPNVSDQLAADTSRQRFLIGNQIIRTGGNSKKTNVGNSL